MSDDAQTPTVVIGPSHQNYVLVLLDDGRVRVGRFRYPRATSMTRHWQMGNKNKPCDAHVVDWREVPEWPTEGEADVFTIENGDMITVFSSSSISAAMAAVDAESRIATEQGVQMTAWSGGRPVRFVMFREAHGVVSATKWGHVDDTEDTETED